MDQNQNQQQDNQQSNNIREELLQVQEVLPESSINLSNSPRNIVDNLIEELPDLSSQNIQERRFETSTIQRRIDRVISQTRQIERRIGNLINAHRWDPNRNQSENSSFQLSSSSSSSSSNMPTTTIPQQFIIRINNQRRLFSRRSILEEQSQQSNSESSLNYFQMIAAEDEFVYDSSLSSELEEIAPDLAAERVSLMQRRYFYRNSHSFYEYNDLETLRTQHPNEDTYNLVQRMINQQAQRSNNALVRDQISILREREQWQRDANTLRDRINQIRDEYQQFRQQSLNHMFSPQLGQIEDEETRLVEQRFLERQVGRQIRETFRQQRNQQQAQDLPLQNVNGQIPQNGQTKVFIEETVERILNQKSLLSGYDSTWSEIENIFECPLQIYNQHENSDKKRDQKQADRQKIIRYNFFEQILQKYGVIASLIIYNCIQNDSRIETQNNQFIRAYYTKCQLTLSSMNVSYIESALNDLFAIINECFFSLKSYCLLDFKIEQEKSSTSNIRDLYEKINLGKKKEEIEKIIFSDAKIFMDLLIKQIMPCAFKLNSFLKKFKKRYQEEKMRDKKSVYFKKSREHKNKNLYFLQNLSNITLQYLAIVSNIEILSRDTKSTPPPEQLKLKPRQSLGYYGSIIQISQLLKVAKQLKQKQGQKAYLKEQQSINWLIEAYRSPKKFYKALQK